MKLHLPLTYTSQFITHAVNTVISENTDISSRISIKIGDEEFEIPLAIIDAYTEIIVGDSMEILLNNLPNKDREVTDAACMHVQNHFGIPF